MHRSDSSDARLYRSYVSDHAGVTDRFTVQGFYDHYVRPALAGRAAGPILEIGCGQGTMLACLRDDGIAARGVDISAEQVAIARRAGMDVEMATSDTALRARDGELAAVLAFDVLEHLALPELIETCDLTCRSLAPGGLLIGRVPNGVSPFVGHIRDSDLTHRRAMTERSLRQLFAATGLELEVVRPCNPIPYRRARSLVRYAAWQVAATGLKALLAVETGRPRGHHVTQNIFFVARRPAADG